MNTFTPISTLKDCIGQEVTLAGWVYKNRPTGKLIFLTVRDGTGLCQCIIEKGEATADFFADAKHLAQESSVTVRGTVRGDERAVGGCELVVSGIELVHAARDYPITPKAHGVEFLMKHRHLWFRSRRQFLIPADSCDGGGCDSKLFQPQRVRAHRHAAVRPVRGRG
jgi:asparaginyl-tRNA synthetase